MAAGWFFRRMGPPGAAVCGSRPCFGLPVKMAERLRVDDRWGYGEKGERAGDGLEKAPGWERDLGNPGLLRVWAHRKWEIGVVAGAGFFLEQQEETTGCLVCCGR